MGASGPFHVKRVNLSMRKTTLTDQYIRLKNGFRLAYYDSGSAAGHLKTVVLLHGFCGSSAYWAELLPQLKEVARVVIPDLRAHGVSEPHNGQVYEMESFAADILELLDKLELKQAALLGHSMGGYIALAALEKYPQRLSGVGLLHSTALADSETAKENRDKAVQTIKQEGLRAFVDNLVPKLFAPRHLETMQGLVQHVKAIGYETSSQGAAASALGMKARPDRTALLRQAAVPVLLVAGALDQVVPIDSTLHTAEGQPKVYTHIAEGSGHLGMLEAAGSIAEAVQRFIGVL